jgi:tocopherol O-methyltransferase
MAEYRELLEHAGFRQVDCLDLTARVKKTWSICARRVMGRFIADPALRRRLRDPRFTNGIFAKTVFRIWLAYRLGSMRFGIFTAVK